MTKEPKNFSELQHPPEYKSSHEEKTSAEETTTVFMRLGKGGKKRGKKGRKGTLKRRKSI